MSPKHLIQHSFASPADAQNDARLDAPSATRNLASILEVLKQFVSKNVKVLEIASGTGQHIVNFAAKFPTAEWQPTDVDPDRIKSIQSWARHFPSPNLHEPIKLDATQPGWSKEHAKWNLIIVTNLLHLISTPDAEVVVQEASKALASGGVLFIYGPFKRGNEFASDGDKSFDLSLRSQDANIGYKSLQEIQGMQEASGLTCEPIFEMPANNLVLIGRKP